MVRGVRFVRGTRNGLINFNLQTFIKNERQMGERECIKCAHASASATGTHHVCQKRSAQRRRARRSPQTPGQARLEEAKSPTVAVNRV